MSRTRPSSRKIALVVSLLVFAETLLLWARFNPASAEFQFVERHAWIPAFGISYAVGVDGISLLLLVLDRLSDAARAPQLVGVGPQEDARRSASSCCCSRAR